MKSMVKSEPSFEEFGMALLDVTKVVEEDSREAVVRVVNDLGGLAELHYWTWAEPSDDLGSGELFRSAHRIKLDVARGLLATLAGPGAKFLRSSVQRVTPELLTHFDTVLAESIKRLDDFRLFCLFVLDEETEEVDTEFRIPFADIPSGPSVALKL